MRLRINRREVTFVSNDVIRGAGLSYGAIGLLAHLLSLDEGEAIDDDAMCTHGICGSDELDGYKQELRAARLLIRRPDGNDDVFDEPQGGM